jgi:hypothetical protein
MACQDHPVPRLEFRAASSLISRRPNRAETALNDMHNPELQHLPPSDRQEQKCLFGSSLLPAARSQAHVRLVSGVCLDKMSCSLSGWTCRGRMRRELGKGKREKGEKVSPSLCGSSPSRHNPLKEMRAAPNHATYILQSIILLLYFLLSSNSTPKIVCLAQHALYRNEGALVSR